MFSIFISIYKMDKVFQEKDLHPITHKEFNEFKEGKGFKGRNDYKLKDLKAMFGFKPITTGSPVTMSSDWIEWNQQDLILFQRLQLPQEYHTVPFYISRRIPKIEFTLMEKNLQ